MIKETHIDFEELKKIYSKMIMLEIMNWHISSYVKFSEIQQRYKSIYKSIITAASVGSKTILDCWNQNKNAMFRSPSLNLIFEVENKDQDYRTSFNSLIKPYELCINCQPFRSDRSTDMLIQYIKSIDFQVLLSHEICHLLQTELYGLGYMKTHIEQEARGLYDKSVVELEACLFMLLEDAQLRNKKLKTSDEVFEYAKSIDSEFLLHAAKMVLENKSNVIDILNHNKEFLSEATSFIESEKDDLVFDLNCVPYEGTPDTSFGYRVNISDIFPSSKTE